MHTIHNIAFEVDVNYNNSLVSWEQYYVDFFQEQLLPRVERMCDDWDKKHPNSKCVIDTIDVDVQVSNLDLAVLQKEIIQQISRQLNSIQSDGSSGDTKIIATITQEASPFEALLEYVSRGILPAHISVKAFKEWLSVVAEFTAVEKNKLATLFSTKTVAIARMLSLLRNDYEKLSTIITQKQQITTHYVTLEKTFFLAFLKEICTQFNLDFNQEEADIWHKTLGVSSSLPQFSKTFMQLLVPKAKAVHKQFTRIEETQVTLSVLQAITQYELGNRITIDASKIAIIQTNTSIQSQKSNTISTEKTANTTKETTTTNTIETTKKKTQNPSQPFEASQQEKEHTNKEIAKKSQNAENTEITTNNTPSETIKNNADTAKKSGDTPKSDKEETVETHITKETETPFFTRKSDQKEISLTTEKAGLVLLHPFLSRFFNGVGLVTEDHKINDIGKACMLLHFLATETEEVTDVELTLEKVLLGIPLATVINYQTPLTETDKQLCEELLQTVLEHWVVLKKSTINTLRDMFLKRDGQLTITKNSLKLKIERTAQDVLLDKVPWNIHLFRLKWMEKMMHIEW